MGSTQSGGLSDASIKRAEQRAGKVNVSGRYHVLPKRIEDDYIIQKKVLGSGYNGSVLLATKRVRDDSKFAVKGFKLIGLTRDQRKDLEAECEIFLCMDHPHVARLVDVYEDEKCLNLVMECMQGGELFDRVQKKRKFSEKDAANAAYQMLLAVNYLHSEHIVHRDLKLENFLYESKESDHLKLIDFGFSKVWEPNTKMAASCGTLAYVAPEVLKQSYTHKCDLWSFGVIVFILLVGYMPFSGSQEQQIIKISSGAYTWKAHAWNRVSDVAIDFIKKLLVVDPHARMSAEKALQHRFITERSGRPDTQSSVDGETVQALCDFAKASAFKRACMSLMAWSLTNEERSRVRNAFLEMDTSRQGTVTLKELKEVLVKKYSINSDEVKHIFAALDTAHNDVINYTEFLAAMVSTRIQMHDELLLQTFKRFDVDNSGYITKENLASVLGENYSGKEVEQLIHEADQTKDGRISYQEFIAYLKGGAADGSHMEVADKLIEAQLVSMDADKTAEPGPVQMQAMHSYLGLHAMRLSMATSRSTKSEAKPSPRTGTGGSSMQCDKATSRACAIL